MRFFWKKQALEDIQHWQENDLKKVKKIKTLILAIATNPTQGIGKPEPLKHNLSSCWSRRIDREHRLVYQVNNEQIIILSCRYHYG